MSKNQSAYMFEYVKKNINFGDFLENEIGCSLKWNGQQKDYATTICPMPHHKDKKPSFSIKIADNNSWIYNCWGCGSKGTIIDFFIDYYSLGSPKEAIKVICKKFNIKDEKEVAINGLKNIKKEHNFKKKVELNHVIVANQCRMLLRKNFDKYNKWVAETYRKINEALDREDLQTIDKIGYEVSKKMEGK